MDFWKPRVKAAAPRAVLAVLVLALAIPFLLTGCESNTPEGAVSKFLGAWQDLNWDAYKKSVAPENQKLTKEQEELAKKNFEQIKVKLDDVKMATTFDEQDKNKAKVDLTAGTITYTAKILGEVQTSEPEDIAKMDPATRPFYNTVNVDGTWYVDQKL